MIRKIEALCTAFLLLVSVLVFPQGTMAEPAAPDEDYLRAFTEGYVDPAWQEETRDRQVLTGEFRDMLVSMISRLAPDRLEWFEQKVTALSASEPTDIWKPDGITVLRIRISGTPETLRSRNCTRICFSPIRLRR